MSALTDEEKSRVRHHLGYIGVQAAQTFVMGFPAAIAPSFVVEGAMDRVMVSEMPNLRRILAVLDQIEGQMVDDLELLAVTRIDTIEVNQKEQEQLRDNYIHWRAALSNLLCVEPNPYDQRFMGGNGVNVTVVH